MASLVYNSLGKDFYRVVVATRQELIAALDDVCECHLCGRECMPDDKMYYIPVLDVVYCPSCYYLWVMSVDYHKIDKPIEQKNLDRIVAKFREIGCWIEN